MAGTAKILTETKGQRTISFAIITGQRRFEMLSRVDKITREPARHAAYSVSDPSFRQLGPTLNIAQEHQPTLAWRSALRQRSLRSIAHGRAENRSGTSPMVPARSRASAKAAFVSGAAKPRATTLSALP